VVSEFCHVIGKKTAMSLKFVTMIKETECLYSRALERRYSTEEETFPLESNKLPGYQSME
jgi:hypothetical protein